MGYNTSGTGITAPLISYPALIGWSTLFALVAMATVIGNVLTIAVFSRRKSKCVRANYFLASLAVADIMVGTISVPMYMYHLVCYWQFGTIIGNTAYFFYMAEDIFSGFSSIFALTVIAIERFYSVMWPLKHRTITKRVYVTLITVVWSLSGLLAILYILDACKILRNRIFFYLIIASLFISLFVICMAYLIIWIKAKFRKFKRESNRNINNGAREHDRKLMMTLLIVTGVFVVTWLPFHIINIIVFVCKIKASCRAIGVNHIPLSVYTLIKLLHYSNSLVNPIVYSLTLPNFKNAVLVLVGRRRSSFLRSFRGSSREPIVKLEKYEMLHLERQLSD